MSKEKKEIDALELHKLLRNKNFVVNFRMNEDLGNLLNETIEKDKSYAKRTDWFNETVISYIQEKNGFDSLM